MSLFAGIYSLKGTPVPPDALAEMRSAFTRFPDEEVKEFSSSRCALLSADIGAFGPKESEQLTDGRFTATAGEALVPGRESKDHGSEIGTIQSSIDTGNFKLLARSRGVFSAADLSSDGALTLLTDRLGIRPVYYWSDAEFLVFSSALRIIEAVSIVPKTMDLRSVTEIAALGYVLGDRTPYCGVRLLGPGGMLKVKEGPVEIAVYSDWNDISVSRAPETELIKELYYRFTDAVSVRLRGDNGAVAYLSGGLDSRCVSAALREQAQNVHTFNFARENTQDQLFGRQFAAKSRLIHTEVPKRPGDQVPDYSTMLAEQWRKSKYRGASPVERPRIAWSGEGGSVDLGHVHLGPEVTKLMRLGQDRAAVNQFLHREEIALPIKLFKKNIRQEMSEMVADGVLEQLESYHCPDPARRFYLFLMLNDQRRKLARHFEELDRHRLEFQLPFFDMDLVEHVMAIPADMCLGHQLYVKWLKLFPEPVASVAWQSYPGHVPCPIDTTTEGAYQWDRNHIADERRVLKRSLIKRATSLLTARDFPSDILDKTLFGAALATYVAGLRDYGYLVETAEVYYKYWSRCSGNYMPLTAK
jgi:asparagine synthase (glutamine-hydrolysing)